jgi:hypothetical protein
LRRAAFILGVVNLWRLVLTWIPQNFARTDHYRDMAIYYLAASRMRDHISIYHVMSPSYGPQEMPQWYVYPPHLAAALMVFNGHYQAFSYFWYAFLIACYFSFAALLARLSFGRIGFESTLLWTLVLAATPAVAGPNFMGLPPSAIYGLMSTGNIDPLLWTLYAAAMVVILPHVSTDTSATTSDRQWTIAQVFLALMTLFKPYAALPWLVMAMRRGVRTAIPGMILVIVLTVATLAVGGARQFTDWLTQAVPLVAQGTFHPINWSISFLVLRLLHGLGWWHYVSGPLPAGPTLFLTLAAIGGPIIAAGIYRRHSVRAQATAVFLASMLFSPLCWQTYLLLAYVPLAMLIGRKTAERRRLAEAASKTQPSPVLAHEAT